MCVRALVCICVEKVSTADAELFLAKENSLTEYIFFFLFFLTADFSVLKLSLF